MSSPAGTSVLERAVSQIDLSKALQEVQIQADTGLRYTAQSLLRLRPTGSPTDTNGIITPPELPLPHAPPPTPATPINGDSTPTAKDMVNSNGGDNTLQALPNGEQPKKKKKKVPNVVHHAVNSIVKGTGFEEFYADPPLTPDEFMEEADLYSVHVPFESRMQTCIQRYRSRRKLDSIRTNILTKYFMLGGIEATAKTFTGGLDKETVENSTAAEIAALQAHDFIRTGESSEKYYDGSDKWVVDFEGVAKGFFSFRVPKIFPIDDQKDVEIYAMTIRNFLNYVLHHRACEDYTRDVMNARIVCDLAEKELWDIKQLQSQIPGDFNMAASTLYGGRYAGVHMGNAEWAMEDPNYKDYQAADQGFSIPEAERIFKTAVAFAGDDQLFQKAMGFDVDVVSSAIKCYEVIEIERPDLQTKAEYDSVRNFEGTSGLIKALGLLKVKYWEGPQLEDEDCTDDEEDDDIDKDAVKTFWLEDDLLQHCYIGLKIEVEVKELNIGIKFIDNFKGLYCSFYTHLPNEKMFGWKDPILSTRPAPSEDDPDKEEAIMDAEAEKDLNSLDKFMVDS